MGKKTEEIIPDDPKDINYNPVRLPLEISLQSDIIKVSKMILL